MTRVLRAAVTAEPISLHDHERLVAQASSGAIVGFAGVVRDHDGGRAVLRLDYSAHPSAEQTLIEVLEEIAASFEGVSKVFALQAGREIRIIVESLKISDDRAALLAKETATKIKNELDYPGQIKVTVIREMRAVEYAR